MSRGEDHYLEGELEDCLLVSVPETTSRQAAAQIKEGLTEDLGKQVIVITHNVAFMKATRLSASEGAKVLKQIEDVVEERGRILAEDGKSVT